MNNDKAVRSLRVGRTYSEIVQENKDKLFIIREDDNNKFHAIMVYNAISGTYMGIKLVIWDDQYGYAKLNADWMFELDTSNIRETLKELGFTETPLDRLEMIIYSGSKLLEEN